MEVWGGRDWDLAIPALPGVHVVEDRDLAGTLHNSAETADPAAKVRQGAAQTTLAQATVLRTISAVDRPAASAAHINWRRFVSSWCSGSGLSAGAAGELLLAG